MRFFLSFLRIGGDVVECVFAYDVSYKPFCWWFCGFFFSVEIELEGDINVGDYTALGEYPLIVISRSLLSWPECVFVKSNWLLEFIAVWTFVRVEDEGWKENKGEL